MFKLLDRTISCMIPRIKGNCDLMSHIQFTEEGWELKGDPEGLDTEQDDDSMFEMPPSL